MAYEEMVEQSITKSSGVEDLHKESPRLKKAYKPFHWLVYVFLGLLAVLYAVLVLQWSLYTNKDSYILAFEFLTKMWSETPSYQFILNFGVWGLVYLLFIFASNRFWVATPIYMTLVTLIAIAERMKVMTRSEVITPADLMFLGKNAGEITSFVPSLSQRTVLLTSIIVVGTIGCSILFYNLDGRKKLISAKSLVAEISIRISLILVPAMVLTWYCYGMGDVNSRARALSMKLSN